VRCTSRPTSPLRGGRRVASVNETEPGGGRGSPRAYLPPPPALARLRWTNRRSQAHPLKGEAGVHDRRRTSFRSRELAAETEQRAVWRAAIRSLYVAIAKPPVRRACGDRHVRRRREARALPWPLDGFHPPQTRDAMRPSSGPVRSWPPAGSGRGQARMDAAHLRSALPWGFSIQPCDLSHHPAGHRRARRRWWPSDVPMGAVAGIVGEAENGWISFSRTAAQPPP